MNNNNIDEYIKIGKCEIVKLTIFHNEIILLTD